MVTSIECTETSIKCTETSLEHQLRPPLAAFARLMEATLRANDRKNRFHGAHANAYRAARRGWAHCPLDYLVRRLRQEYEELRRALAAAPKDPDHIDYHEARRRIAREAADVANFVMMIADVFGDIDPPSLEESPIHRSTTGTMKVPYVGMRVRGRFSNRVGTILSVHPTQNGVRVDWDNGHDMYHVRLHVVAEDGQELSFRTEDPA